MKKIYLLFAMMLGLFSTAASAQELFKYVADEDNPLITEVDQFSSPYSDSGEGNFYSLIGKIDECPEDQHPGNDFWHSDWHHGDQEPGTHYFQVDMSNVTMPDKMVFVMTRRPADNDHTTEWIVMGTNDPDAAKADCEELAYIKTPFKDKNETVTSSVFSNPDGFKYLRFYSEVQQGASYNNRGYFHLARFQIYPAKKVQLDPWETKLSELSTAWEKYSTYIDEYAFEDQVGTEPGMFTEEAVQTYMNYVYFVQDDIIENWEVDPDVVTVDSLQNVIDKLEVLYQAVLASRIPLNLTDGYYKIRAGMGYVNSIVTGKDDDGNDITEDMDVLKYMYSVLSDGKYYARWNTPSEELPECYYLWKVTNKGDGTYDLVNCATNTRLDSIARSTNATMSDNANMVAFDIVGNIDGEPMVNIRVATQNANDYLYAHQGGHSNGKGVDGNIVGWCTTGSVDATTCGASEWVLEDVAEAEALAIIAEYEATNKPLEEMRDNYKMMVKDAKAKLPIAQDIQKIIEDDKPIVSDDNPITSPCSDSAEGTHIEYLWDGKGDNFWHTDWHGEFTLEDHHYLQVEIPEDVDLPSAIFRIQRRNTTSGNQINKWTVWGTNHNFADDLDEDGKFVEDAMVQGSEGLEKLADLTTPYTAGANTEVLLSEPFETKGYKYLRFYCAGTCNNDGTQGSNEKFFHIAEFQLFPGRMYESPTSQYKVMGDIATNLEAVIEAQKDIDVKELTVEEFNTFKAVYDAFIEKFVDPADLRAAVKKYDGLTAEIAIGTDPGFWPDNSTAEALNKTIADAKAYDEAGAYLPATSENFLATLDAQAKAYNEAPNKVQTGKWYRFRFGTEEEYDKYEWSKNGNTPDYRVVDEDTIGIYNEALFGKYFTVATWTDVEIDTDDNGNAVNSHVITPISKDSVTLNNYLFVDALEDIKDPDMALFRFVSIGDSAYAIQNKATGLYLQSKPEDGDIRMTIHPSLFYQQVNGFGQNAFFIKNLDNSKRSPLHTARNYNIICSWGNESGTGYKDGDGRRGSFFVEEVGDATDYVAPTQCQFKAWPGAASMRCYPVTVSVDEEEGTLWSVAKIDRTPADEEVEGSVEEVKITFCQVENNTAIAGRPFIFIADGEFVPEKEREEDDEPEFITLNYLTDFVSEYQTSGALKGSFGQTEVGQGALLVKEDGEVFEITKTGAKVGTDTSYISETDAPFERKAEVELVYDEKMEDGIISVLNKVSQKGAIYTIDGSLVSKSGNLNTIKSLKPGTYIINGVSVIKK